jgi:hypothetical protein
MQVWYENSMRRSVAGGLRNELDGICRPGRFEDV